MQFDFEFEGVRYRPTLKRTPTEGNLRRALVQLIETGERSRVIVMSFASLRACGPRSKSRCSYPTVI